MRLDGDAGLGVQRAGLFIAIVRGVGLGLGRVSLRSGISLPSRLVGGNGGSVVYRRSNYSVFSLASRLDGSIESGGTGLSLIIKLDRRGIVMGRTCIGHCVGVDLNIIIII